MVAIRFAFVVVLAALLAASASWAQDDEAPSDVLPADELYRIQLELEQVITGLALDDSLDTAATDALRRELAKLYHDLEQLASVLGAAPPETATPPPDPAEWRRYSAASKQVFPNDAEFSGWSQDSNLGVEMGGYGQILLRIENSYYLAEWNIQGGYNGMGTASVSATTDGDVLLVVVDSQGSREFKLEDGGIGASFMRMLETVEPAEEDVDEPFSEPESESEIDSEIEIESEVAAAVVEDEDEDEGEWYSAYLDLVRDGVLESNEAMKWFINQANVHTYETDALRDLGEALNRMGGGKGSETAIGDFVHYLAGERQVLDVPDPRSEPLEFSHLINLAYILTLEDKPYSVELN